MPAGDVLKVAADTGAILYDVPNVELGHYGERCSFDAFIEKEASGLLAISKGLSLNFADDHEMLQAGIVTYDALYAWCADTPLKKVARMFGMK